LELISLEPATYRQLVEDRGFAVIPGILKEDRATLLAADLATANPRRSRAGVRHALGHAAVASLANNSRLLEIAREILSANAYPFRATMFEKTTDANWLVVWHQDTALPLRRRQETPGWGPWSVKEGVIYAHAPASALSQVLALRVHLDDSTSQNGPLRVLPATHKFGVLSDDAIHQLAQDIAPVECCVPRGGVVAMKPLVVHSSSKSQSECARRVLHIEYAANTAIAGGLELAVA
jgi:ectoine hydroxylase-related dioxygenase (phytanoyl-CoA dioxygenase family)